MVLAFGFYVNRKKIGYSIYGVMLAAFLIGVCINVSQKMGGNPRIDALGIAQENGAMEGKVESGGGWLNNPGFHGLGEMLYEFTSCAANNGSGFEGLGDNTWFWNVSCGIVLIMSRFIPIIGQVAIAGMLAQKKYIPESAGTLKTNTVTFGVMTFAVIFIVAALSFFPAQALSTIAEHFSL